MYRSVKDDAAVVVQQRRSRIHGKECAVEIGVDDVFKGGFLGLANRRGAADAGIGENDVELPEISGQGVEEPLAVFGDGDVGAVAARVASATKRRAVASPMPLLPPVMRAFLPASFITPPFLCRPSSNMIAVILTT
jgi:hypothetical protein